MIDLAIAAVLVLCAVLGWKRGLIRSLAELAVMIVALGLANQIASAAAPVIVDKTLRPATYAAIELRVDELVQENVPSLSPVQELERIAEAIPNRFVREHVQDLIGGLGLFQEGSLDATARETLLCLGYQLADTALDGVVCNLIRSILCAVCFTVLTVLLRLTVKVLTKAVKLPGLKQINELGGLLLGVGKGLLLVCLGIWVLRLTGVITPEMAESSILIGLFSAWTAKL